MLSECKISTITKRDIREIQRVIKFSLPLVNFKDWTMRLSKRTVKVDPDKNFIGIQSLVQLIVRRETDIKAFSKRLC